MISYKTMRRELKNCRIYLQKKLKEPIMCDGTLESAMELRNHIWTLEWILEANDDD